MLTEPGWRAARRWGLSTIVDLWCAYEIGARDGNPAVAEDPLAGIAIVHSPTEDHDDPEFRDVCFPLLDSPE